MASLRDIKLRIRSVKSTQKITKAMEMISASKMKRAQNQALKGRPYLTKLTEIITNLVYHSEPALKHPLLEKRPNPQNIGYIFITANRGLCGGFNSNVIRKMLEVLKENKDKKETVITVGHKGRQAMERIGKSVMADFEGLSEKPTFVDTLGITKVVLDDFLEGKLDEVWMVYNHFYSTLIQKPVAVKLFPIEIDQSNLSKVVKRDYIFEPNRQELLNELLHRYVENSVYQTVLESSASEHSARMMAMRQASDNAEEIVDNLTLHYNKARQAKITKEILEVVAGSTN